jgi:hypothetical protein
VGKFKQLKTIADQGGSTMEEIDIERVLEHCTMQEFEKLKLDSLPPASGNKKKSFFSALKKSNESSNLNTIDASSIKNKLSEFEERLKKEIVVLDTFGDIPACKIKTDATDVRTKALQSILIKAEERVLE